MNSRLGGDRENIRAYNVSISGFYLPKILRRFPAICGEFPEAQAIVLETGSTDFTLTELEQALDLRSYDPAQRGSEIMKNISLAQRVKMGIKEALPILSLASKQWETMQEGADSATQEPVDMDTYRDALRAALAVIRDCYDGPVVIAYHPRVEICADGTLALMQETTENVFAQVCGEYGIEFVSAGEYFLEAYARDHSVSYGFANTTMGSGHMNAVGNEAMAQVIYEALQREGIA